MDFNLEISPYAELQLLDILAYYLETGTLERMGKVEFSIIYAIKQIHKDPFVNKIYENVSQPNANLRRYVVKAVHFILYEINGEMITIIDIFDGRRNPEKLRH